MELITEDSLRELSIPSGVSLWEYLEALLKFLRSNQEFLEQTEEYQLALLSFLHSIHLTPKQRKKRKVVEDNVAKGGKEVDTSAAGSDNYAVRNGFSDVFMFWMRTKLSRKAHVKVLLRIHDRIIPYLSQPLLLADFLVSSFSRGGIFSILALNGLFTLIQEYHLDFPQFYEKFYNLLTPEVLEAKYRARFFYLADLFMASSHVPTYTVAAVAKRLSRLSLTASADSLPMLLTFVMNLVIRHPTLLDLVHRTDEIEDVDADPYKSDVLDLPKCGAMESSLWELKTLSRHYNDQISKLALKLGNKPPDMEYDVAEYLETDVEEMLDAVLPELATNSQPEEKITRKTPASLFSTTSPFSLINFT